MNPSQLKYPLMRNEVVETLLSLSNLDYQKKCWVQHTCPDNIEYDDLNSTLHILYDDTSLAVNPENYIGTILKNKNEANLLIKLCELLDYIFNKYGLALTDEEYINTPEWLTVLSAAQHTYKVFVSPDDG